MLTILIHAWRNELAVQGGFDKNLARIAVFKREEYRTLATFIYTSILL